VDQYDDRWEDWTRWADGRYCCFSYILLSSLLVMLVSWDSEHRECECVSEEKDFPPLLCCAIYPVLPCLGVCFVSSPITRRFIAAVIRRSTIADL